MLETTFERSRRLALEWVRERADNLTGDQREAFADDYATYVDELPELTYPDAPKPTPGEYAADNLVTPL
jgi:hypothetical protein